MLKLSSELKPCPFCGGKAYSYFVKPHKHVLVNMPEYSGGGFVECSSCTACVSANSKEEAESLWNSRTDEK